MTNRLTERAKDALFNVSDLKSTLAVSVDSVVASIKKSGGVGNYLLTSNPNLTINKKKVVNINLLVEKAYFFSANLGHVYVGTEHLLLALLELSNSPDVDSIKIQIKGLNTFPNTTQLAEMTSKTPILDAFCTNLNKEPLSLLKEPLVDRDEVNFLISTLIQKNSPNALIIGDYGVGRKTLVELLASRINTLQVPVALGGYQIIEFDIMSFIASLSGRENIDSTINTFVEELDSLGDVILYIKDFQGLFVGTGAGYVTPLAFSILKSYLTSANISIIGVLSTTFFNKLSEESVQLFNDFDEVFVEEPEDKITLAILKSKAVGLSRYHNVAISKEIIEYAFDRAKNARIDEKFPGKLVYLLDQACTKLLVAEDVFPKNYKKLVDQKAKLVEKYNDYLEKSIFNKVVTIKNKLSAIDQQLTKVRAAHIYGNKLALTKTYIDEVLSDLDGSNILESKIDLDHLSNLSKSIKKKIIGQDLAVDIVSKALVRSRLGLRSKKRPLGNFLFLGPTGVGKTELAKVLAFEGFGEDNLIRLDMSDFSEKHNVARLVGAPPGYVGYGEGGELTSKIESKPDSVVLFDEIEKAHPDVLNILLQILEEGELRDAKGQTFDFSRSVVILTSNLGTDIVLKAGVGFADKLGNENQIEDRLRNNLKKILKPELLNRFDEIVVFKKLNHKSHEKILNLLLSEVLNTIKKQNIQLNVDKEVKQYLIKKGYSDEYGARSIRRIMEKELLDKLAEYLLTTSKRPLSLKATIILDQIQITLT